jgi:hypothetical protein
MASQEMWTSICICPRHARDIEAVCRWLKLSGSQPLSISLDAHCDRELADDALYGSIALHGSLERNEA